MRHRPTTAPATPRPGRATPCAEQDRPGELRGLPPGLLVVGLAAVAILLGTPARAAAQAAPGLSLDEVVRTTLRSNADVRLGNLRAEASRGQYLAAGAVFGTQLTSRFAGIRGEETEIGASADGPDRTSEFQMGLERQLRFGLTLASGLNVLRMQPESALPLSSSQVQLSATLPLLKNRGGGLWGSLERAADVRYRADALTALHETATSIRDAVFAYWRYRAAEQRLAIYLESESRAERLVEEMRSLVAGEERPPADLNHVLANAAGKRVSRIAAEQVVLNARRELGLLLGMDARKIQALPATLTDFPQPAPFDPDSATVERLTQLAVARRADLSASAEQVRSADLLLRAARSDLRPRLDLSGTVAYAGLATGRGVDRWALALSPRERGFQGTLALQYYFPVSGGEERGRWIERNALREQQRVVNEQLAREVASGVMLAVEALRHSSLALQVTSGSMELYRTTVENQWTRYRLSAATLFDVLLSEEALTSARLSETSNQLEYALALARLRFETGTLVERGEDGPVVDATGLTRPP